MFVFGPYVACVDMPPIGWIYAFPLRGDTACVDPWLLLEQIEQHSLCDVCIQPLEI